MFPPRTMLLSHTTVQPQKIIYLYRQLSGIENNLLAPCFSTAGFNLSRQMLFYIHCLDASTSMTQLLLLVYTTFEKCTFNLFNDLGLKTTCYLVHAPPCMHSSLSNLFQLIEYKYYFTFNSLMLPLHIHDKVALHYHNRKMYLYSIIWDGKLNLLAICSTTANCEPTSSYRNKSF